MHPRSLTQPARKASVAELDNQHRRHRPDYWLLILSLALLAVGIVVVYAISPALSLAHNVSGNYFVTRQVIAIGLSIVAFVVTSRIPIRTWRQAFKPLLVFAALATLLALILPVNAQYPAHRWIRLGSFSFQSVELLKFAVLIWLAGLLSSRIKQQTIPDVKTTLKPLLVAVFLVGGVVAGIQSDLGSTGVIVLMMGVMAYVAGLPMRRLLMIGGIISIGLILAVSSTPYRRERFMTFLHPTADCQGTGYPACQALISVGSGGVIGLGLGRSVQAYGYLPEAANDSIFAIYAEKFGFIGVALLLVLFGAFFGRLKNLAERAPNDFTRMLIVGVLTWLSVQTIINIGAMLGLLPLKGITLPLVSYGGTSVVFVMAALGIVFNISRYTSYTSASSATDNRRNPNEDSIERRRVRRPYHADLGRSA